ncbi:MAG: phage major capsid protein [Acidimicrobiales bacterium]
MRTALDYSDDAAQLLDQIDDILRTAQQEGRPLTADEQTEHDDLDRQYQQLIRKRDAASIGGVTRSLPITPSFNVNIGAVPARHERSLDELLWATADTVPAGSITRNGTVAVSPHGARNPVEPVIVRSEDGYLASAPRLDSFDPAHRGIVRQFQDTVADMALFGLLVDKRAFSSAEGFEVARSHPLMRDRWTQIMRALDVDTVSEGGTWVPTGIGASLHELVRASGKIAPLFPRIDLPTNPWKWPIEGVDATAYRVAEPATDTVTKMAASTPGTVAATFDAEIFGGRVLFSRSVEADSAVAMLPYVRGKLARVFVTAEERAILDGDADGTHQDSDAQSAGATDARSAWDGVRKKALAQTATNGGNTAASVGALKTMRASMLKWGLDPADLAFIVGVSNYHDLVGDDAVVPVDKMGPNATILSGQLGSLWGVPIIVSEHVREDLNAAGIHDGITTNRSYALCVNRGEWAIGQRMATDIEVDDSIYRETFQRVMVAFQREDFQHIGSDATNEDTAITFNVAP